MQVPLTCDLGQVVPQLAELRSFEGCLQLPLAKADALDPSRSAALPGEEGRPYREVCVMLCYVMLCYVMLCYVAVSGGAMIMIPFLGVLSAL